MRLAILSTLFLVALLAPLCPAESVSGLRARSLGTNGTELRWTNPASVTAVLLRIERKQPGAKYAKQTDLPASTTCWTDRTAHPDENYSYRILSLDSANTEIGVSAACEALSSLPDADSRIRFRENTLSLAAGTSVDFVCSIPRRGRVIVRILTTDFEQVTTLLDAESQAGTLDLSWDGSNSEGTRVNPGLYLVALRSPSGNSVSKAVVLP